MPTTDGAVPIIGPLTPENPPSTAINSGSVTATNVYYVYTKVNTLGEESPPSPRTGPYNLTGQKVTLTVEEAEEIERIDAYRVYRVDDGTDGVYKLVADSPTASGIEDDYAGSELGPALGTENKKDPPPMSGMAIGSYEASWAGWDGSRFYQTISGSTTDWSPDAINLDAPIIAAIGSDYGWLVLHENSATLITGSGDGTTINKNYGRYGCSHGAAFTVVKTGIGWVWFSKQGLVAWDGHSFALLTHEAFSDEQWAELIPSADDPIDKLKAAWVDDEYRLFHNCGCLRMDLRNPAVPVFTSACVTADALFSDRDGTLYVADSDGDWVKPWAGGEPMQYVVQFGEIKAQSEKDATHVEAAMIHYTNGPIRARWYIAGVQHGADSYDPADNYCIPGLQWCPRGAWNRTSLELWGTGTIHSITFNPRS